MARLILILSLAFLLLLGTAGYRAWSLSQQAPIEPSNIPTAIVPAKAVVTRLSGALRIPTVSVAGQPPGPAFAEFQAYLRSRFPKLFARFEPELINGGGLLLHWPGSDPEAPATLLLAHYDVVPVAEAEQWTYPPFSGAVADGYIWGRGALDDKSSVLALLETFSALAYERFEPRRSIYLAFGHDEEIGGEAGAAKIAEHLRNQGIRIGLAMDEGGAITQGIVPGVEQPVASLMLAEKGYLSLELVARATGGHSSIPGDKTAVGELSAAVAAVAANPMPARITPPVLAGLEALLPHRPWIERVAIANPSLFAPLLLGAMSKNPVSNALIRTTTAPTMLRAGVKDNVLPGEASAVINFRLLPGDDADSVEAHVRATINNPEVEIRPWGDFSSPSSQPSDVKSPYYKAVASAVKQTLPEALIHTGLVTGATDLRHYAGLYDTRINFLPVHFGREDLGRVHGRDERIAIQDYLMMIACYARIIQAVDALEI